MYFGQGAHLLIPDHDISGTPLFYYWAIRPFVCGLLFFGFIDNTMTWATTFSNTTIPLSPFSLSIPDSQLDDLRTLLRLTRLPKETYENTQTKENFGVTREWVAGASKVWQNEFDWCVYDVFSNALLSR